MPKAIRLHNIPVSRHERGTLIAFAHPGALETYQLVDRQNQLSFRCAALLHPSTERLGFDIGGVGRRLGEIGDCQARVWSDAPAVPSNRTISLDGYLQRGPMVRENRFVLD